MIDRFYLNQIIMIRAKYQDFPRKTKKAIKRNFMKTIDSNWKPKEVKIKEVRMIRYGERPEYKCWTVSGYQLGCDKYF